MFYYKEFERRQSDIFWGYIFKNALSITKISKTLSAIVRILSKKKSILNQVSDKSEEQIKLRSERRREKTPPREFNCLLK